MNVTRNQPLHTGPLFRTFAEPTQLIHGNKLIAEAFVAKYSVPGDAGHHPDYLKQAGIKHVTRSLASLSDQSAVLRSICKKDWLELAWSNAPRRLGSNLAELVEKLGDDLPSPEVARLTLGDLDRVVREACQIGEIDTGQSFWGSLHNAALGLRVDVSICRALEELGVDRRYATNAYLKLNRAIASPLNRFWTVGTPGTIKAITQLDGGRVASVLAAGGVAVVDGHVPKPPTLRQSDGSIVAYTEGLIMFGSAFEPRWPARTHPLVREFEVTGIRFPPDVPSGHVVQIFHSDERTNITTDQHSLKLRSESSLPARSHPQGPVGGVHGHLP